MTLPDLISRAIDLSPSAAILVVSLSAMAVTWKAMDILAKTLEPKSRDRKD